MIAAHRDLRGALKERSGDEFVHFEPHEFQQLGIGQIGFGERDHARFNAEHAADFKMLARLRLDRFQGGDNEQHQIDAGRACEHIAHETLMARDVDEPDANIVGQLQMREAEVDGDAAPLLLGKRSASVPVSALTSAVLPWSMWPAVPTIMFLMRAVLIV